MLAILSPVTFLGCGSSAVVPPPVVSEANSPISHLVSLLDASKNLTYRATYTVESIQFGQASSQAVTIMQKPPKLAYSSDGQSLFTTSASSDAELGASTSTTVTCYPSSSGSISCETHPPNSMGMLDGAEGYLGRQSIRGELDNVAGGLKSNDPSGLIDSVQGSAKTVAGQHSQCLIAIGTPASASALFCLNSLGVLTFAKSILGTVTLTSFSTSVSESDHIPPSTTDGT